MICAASSGRPARSSAAIAARRSPTTCPTTEIIPAAERVRLVAEYEAEFDNPYVAASRGYVDAVILPSETRPRLIAALELLKDKRETNPPKKHGNIPL